MRSSILRALPVVTGIAASALCAALSCAPTYAEGVVKVVTDRAKVFRIDEPADTIIIGNPAIADATMHDRTTLVITGKAYGTTNLVILNKAGNPIIDEVIAVEPPGGSVVTLMRAKETYSYDCTPACKPHLNIGDDKDFFDNTYKQVSQRRALSEGGGEGQSGQ
ncbi:pilus assembly protein N-terminal domain-containing protein [Breoghania sp.]|uniref:pilus assembly protein N-terminal domain-containing protein n=1 Tax=Breoghania sp. TaxID=2065378 RepID=UPI0029CA7A2C|nr:pilus assembly protein N-terminal domain-containing protein [Breoghania sp.]